MEILVVVAHHRNQYHSRSSKRSFGSPHSRDFREINCRTFQSGTGILPTPLKACSSPVTKHTSFSPKTPSPPVNIHHEPNKFTEKIAKNSSVPIAIKLKQVDYSGNEGDECFYSEKWAGPAYSNSPPPSSLPIPKFSIRPTRTVSIDLPSVSNSDIDLLPVLAKSAPPSPSRDHKSSHVNLFYSDDSATKTLRRILNLDLADGVKD